MIFLHLENYASFVMIIEIIRRGLKEEIAIEG